MKPLVSIIIPAYNKAEFTARAVLSVLDQTYPNIETFVIDDGSTDSTKERMAEFKDKIHYVYKENGGACSARNLGISLAKGEFVGFLDCDDAYMPEKVEKSIDYLMTNKQFDVVYTAAYFIDQHNVVVGKYSHPQSRHTGWISKRLVLQNFICNSTPIIRTKCLDEVGLFDESVFTPGDWDLMIRVSERCQIGYIDAPLTRYNVHQNYIFSNLEISRTEEMKVLKKTFSRDNHYGFLTKQKAFSKLHLRYAQCYFLKNDADKFKKEIWLAIKTYWLNAKAFALLIYLFLARKSLRKYLEGKILRSSAKEENK